MVNNQRIVRLLQSALPHLYDHVRLRSHPVASVLGVSAADAVDSGLIRTRLLEAIESLRPAEDLPRTSRPWRNYRYLVLRYVNLVPVAQIARELGLSERQSQRVHAEALEELAAVISARVSPRSNMAGTPTGQATTDAASTADNGEDALQDLVGVGWEEAARLASQSREHSVTLSEAVEGALKTIANMPTARGTKVLVALPPDLPPVAAERTLLRQGLIALLIALLRTRPHSLSLSGRARADASQVELSVTASYAEGTTQTSRLAAAIEEDESFHMGARIGRLLKSSVAVGASGSTVSLSLALPARKRTTILIVDDNPDTVRLLKRYLGGDAYDVLEASSGAMAVEMARQYQPSLITLDVMMPEQDGWETLQTLRNDPLTQGIPVIVCSVIDQQELALSLGAAMLLPKPVSRNALLQAVARCLADSEARSS